MSLPAFEAFKTSFRGDLVLPSSSEYEQAISRWAANAQRRASLVTYPKDSSDISTLIKWLASNKIPFAVKGGGHSATGASSIQDGVIIDLSKYLNGARVDPERKLVYVGGGALWKVVDEESMKFGLATVSFGHVLILHQYVYELCCVSYQTAGTVNHTGVGGSVYFPARCYFLHMNIIRLILGGGYGYLSSELGLAIDNLQEVRLLS